MEGSQFLQGVLLKGYPHPNAILGGCTISVYPKENAVSKSRSRFRPSSLNARAVFSRKLTSADHWAKEAFMLYAALYATQARSRNKKVYPGL